MLDPDEVLDIAREMWDQHLLEQPGHDRVYEFLHGRRGRPGVPEGATEEIKEIARLSVKNVLRPIVKTYVAGLGVVGFRSPAATENEPIWDLWQRQRMDARQAEIYRPAISYGVSYVASVPPVADAEPVFRPRSPRQIYAVYEDPQVDLWPRFGLETWLDPYALVRRGLLLDDELRLPADHGPDGAGGEPL